MANSHVDIGEETFDLVAIPHAQSKMVQNAKDLLLGLLDLQSLVDDLGNSVTSFAWLTMVWQETPRCRLKFRESATK